MGTKQKRNTFDLKYEHETKYPDTPHATNLSKTVQLAQVVEVLVILFSGQDVSFTVLKIIVLLVDKPLECVYQHEPEV